MKSLMMLFNVTVMLLMSAVMAMADTGQTPGDDVVLMLNQTVFPVLSAFLMGLVGLALRWIAKKYKMDALVSNNELIESVAVRGIGLAEEMAARIAKTSVNKKLEGNDKLAIAVSHVTSMVPAISHDHAVEVVEGLLARIKGAGATGEKAI